MKGERIWRGRVSAIGAWLPAPSPAAILRLWKPGSALYSGIWGCLVGWPAAEWVDCAHLPGLALVERGTGWTAYPEGEPGPGQLDFYWQGKRTLVELAALSPDDLGWLWDRSGLVYYPGQSLSRPAPPPSFRAPPAPPSARQVLESIPEPAPQRQEFLSQLSQGRPPRRPLAGFFDLLWSFFGQPRNQDYVRRMIALFEQGRWQDALRYAIPIDDSEAGRALARFLGELQPRQDLQFTPADQRAAGVAAGAQGLEFVRELYERSLTAMRERGLVNEAVFLMAEILGRVAEAVQLLEEHGKFREAARLAGIKGLPAVLQVRLWIRAGDLETALRLGRRFGVQAEALRILRDQGHLEEALGFQLLWARDLFQAGRFRLALQVGFEVREHLPEWGDWVQLSLLCDGPDAADSLALGLSVADVRRRLGLVELAESWLEDGHPAGFRRRSQLVRALAGAFPSGEPELDPFMGKVARIILGQVDSPFPLESELLPHFARLSRDPWLLADLPKLPPRSRSGLGLCREEIRQRGTQPLWDAVFLPDGRLLLALGEPGALLLARSGRIAQRFSAPCHGWVEPAEGDLYLGLAGRGRSLQIQRLRLHSGRVEPWCLARIDRQASQHDGYHWLVLVDGIAHCIDLRATEWASLGAVELEGTVRELTAGPEGFGLLVQGPSGPTWDFYDFPSLQRRSRQSVQRWPGLQILSPHQSERWETPRSGVLTYLGRPFPFEFSAHDPRSFAGHGAWAVSRRSSSHGLSLQVLARNAGQTHFQLDLPESRRLQYRLNDSLLSVVDDVGRCLVYDLERSRWLRQIFL